MCKFYLNKSRKYLSHLKRTKEDILVNKHHRFQGTIELKSGKKLYIKLFPGFKQGGPQGTIPKNPNKMIIQIKEMK